MSGTAGLRWRRLFTVKAFRRNRRVAANTARPSFSSAPTAIVAVAIAVRRAAGRPASGNADMRMGGARAVRKAARVIATGHGSTGSAAALLDDLQPQTPVRRGKIRADANVGLLCAGKVGCPSLDDKAAPLL